MKLIESVMNPQGQQPPGLYPFDSESDYRAVPRLNPSSLAAGLLSDWEVDPLMVRLAYESGGEKRTAAQQDRLDRGTLAHLAILQPELLESRVAVWRGDRRAGSEWNEFCLANEGKLLIREDDHAEVMRAAAQALDVPRVRQLCAGVEVEVALFGEENGIFTKGRADAISRSSITTIIDLKTTEAGIDSHSVQRTIRDFHYREKMAMYRRMYCQATGAEPDLVKCFNVFVKLPPPVSIRVVQFTSGALEFGEMRMLKAMERVRECIQANHWPIFVGDDMADVADWEVPEEETDYAS